MVSGCANYSRGERLRPRTFAALQEPKAPQESKPAQQKEQQLSEDEIRQRRNFKSETNIYRVLETPGDILELPWYPIKWFLNLAERNDLFTRIQDIFYFNDEQTIGWFPNVSVGGELRSGYGLSVFHHDLFDKGHRADASFLLASEASYEVRAAYTILKTDDNPFHAKVSVHQRRDTEVEVFVRPGIGGAPEIGNDTKEENETDYAIRRFRGFVEAGYTFGGEFDVTARLEGDVARTFKPRQALLNGLQGFGEEISTIGLGVDVTWERRDDPVRPSRGWALRGGFTPAVAPEPTDAGTRYAFYEYDVDAEYVFPLWAPHRVIVLRQRLQRISAFDNANLPFYRLPVLDRNHGLRAYERNRFQDRAFILTNLEYRFPIWETWDAFAFGDMGQTFRRYKDLEIDAFRWAAGGGIRFMNENSLLFLLQIGFGADGAETVFSLGTVF